LHDSAIMKKLRDIIVFAIVAIGFAVCMAMFRRAFGFTSVWFSLMVMANFLGLVAFARPLFRLKLPGFLRNERAWEIKGRIYKTLRVPAFGALLRRTPLRYLNPLVYFKQHPDASIVQAQLESAEAAHVFAAALLVPYMFYASVHGLWTAAASLTVFQIIFNLYPIMHLRWVRIRINRLHRRSDSSRTASAGVAAPSGVS
jgi:hypothetical protein